MSYLKKPRLLRQQQKLQELVDERLKDEASKVKERVYQWLNNNQYFTDNELFDFYFCVAQNIAAVEVLGGSGKKIVRAKKELEQSAEAYKIQIVETSSWIHEQLKGKLENIQKNQHKLDTKLIEVLEEIGKEHQNIKTISTGLVNSTSVLLKKQKQLLVQTEVARKTAFFSVIVAWVVPCLALIGWIVILLLQY